MKRAGPDPLIPVKNRFLRAREVAYLDTAAEGLPPDTAAEALARYFHDKSLGTPGRPAFYSVEREVVEKAALLLGTAAENVTLLAHASDGLNVLSGSIRWQAGDEVLINDLEFPSNVLPWLRLRELGVNLRVVRSESGVVPYEQFASAITPGHGWFRSAPSATRRAPGSRTSRNWRGMPTPPARFLRSTLPRRWDGFRSRWKA